MDNYECVSHKAYQEPANRFFCFKNKIREGVKDIQRAVRSLLVFKGLHSVIQF